MKKATLCAVLAQQLNTDFFKALADPSRLNLLIALTASGGERTVSQIAECCPLSLSVVSRHLKMLKDGGILMAERRGKETVYRVRSKDVAQQLRALADTLERCCAD